MKNKLILGLVLLFNVQFLKAQLFKADFEDWQSNFLYDEPAHFLTYNFYSFLLNGSPNVTQIAGVKNSAVHLKNLENVQNPDVGILSLSDVSIFPQGGIPFTQIPDSISFYTRFHMVAGDTGLIAIVFKRVGIPISFNVFPIYGDQPNFVKNVYPIQTSGIAPDSLIFIAISGNANNPKPGSYLDIDEFKMIGTTKQIENSSFDSWEPIQFEEPSQWATPNLNSTIFRSSLAVTKVTDASSGLYAVKLESVPLSAFGNNYTLGTLGLGDAATGTIRPYPIQSKNMHISFDYKYLPQGLDTAWMILGYTKFDPIQTKTNTLQFLILPIFPASTYQHPYFDVNLTDACDSMGLFFTSGNGIQSFAGSGPPTLGSQLFLDNIVISPITKTEDANFNKIQIKSNPVQDEIVIENVDASLIKSIRIVDEQGRYVITQPAEIRSNSIQVNFLPPGKYLLQLQEQTTTHLIQFIKI